MTNSPRGRTVSRITEVAKSKGIANPTELVKVTHIGFSTARLIWDNSNYVPTRKILDDIANALGVSSDSLIDWVVEEAHEQSNNDK